MMVFVHVWEVAGGKFEKVALAKERKRAAERLEMVRPKRFKLIILPFLPDGNF
jgi:hypothetical protein